MGRHELLDELLAALLESSEPCWLAAALMDRLLGEVDGLLIVLNTHLGHIATLAQVQQVQRDLQQIGELRERWQLGLLFSPETRSRCGVIAIPIMATVLVLVWRWIVTVRAWLKGAAWIRHHPELAGTAGQSAVEPPRQSRCVDATASRRRRRASVRRNNLISL